MGRRTEEGGGWQGGSNRIHGVQNKTLHGHNSNPVVQFFIKQSTDTQFRVDEIYHFTSDVLSSDELPVFHQLLLYCRADEIAELLGVDLTGLGLSTNSVYVSVASVVLHAPQRRSYLKRVRRHLGPLLDWSSAISVF